MKENQNFSMTEGETKYITIQMDETEEQLSGSTLTWNGAGIVKSVPVEGNAFKFKLEPSDTIGKKGYHRHHGEITDVEGNVSSVIKGSLSITDG
jgi:hypothetical protein